MDLLHHFNHNRCFGTVYLIYYMLVNDFSRPKTELLIFFKQNSIYLFSVCLCSHVARLIGLSFKSSVSLSDSLLPTLERTNLENFSNRCTS